MITWGGRYISLFTWANVLPTGGYNVVHTHNRGSNPGEWSGVVYLDVGDIDQANPESGAFEYFDPRGDTRSGLYPHSQMASLKNGTLLIFPSYLKHMVHPYTG
jgi:hypothetical protein